MITNGIILFIVGPTFIVLLMAANKKQDINIIQASWKAGDHVRKHIKDTMNQNKIYRWSNYTSGISVLFGVLGAEFLYFRLDFPVFLMVVSVICCLVLSIAFRAHGYIQVLRARPPSM